MLYFWLCVLLPGFLGHTCTAHARLAVPKEGPREGREGPWKGREGPREGREGPREGRVGLFENSQVTLVFGICYTF